MVAQGVDRKASFQPRVLPPCHAQAMQSSMKAEGATGIKISAVDAWVGRRNVPTRSIYRERGRVPLHTLRANVDYGFRGPYESSVASSVNFFFLGCGSTR